jgi:hypothetical protein
MKMKLFEHIFWTGRTKKGPDMSRLRYLIATCVVALTVGGANATTFEANGIFSSDGATLTGTMDVSALGVISNVSLFVSGENYILGANPGFVAPNVDSLPLVSNPFCCAELSMTVLFTTPDANDVLNYTGGPIISSAGGFISQTDDVQFNGVVTLASGLTGTFSPVSTTPLPAALPLFGAGLGVMGLFGWRRRKRPILSQTPDRPNQ